MKKKILIVDDSYMMRVIIRKIIESDEALEVAADAQNGLVALDKAKATKPDIVLLDIEMPEMDGLECLKKLRLISRAKVIIISSVAQVGSPQAMEARRLGAVEVIAKPSGAVSMDLERKQGRPILEAIHKVLGS
ncbi:response regulator [Magnetococcales bacterium HHB-1]